MKFLPRWFIENPVAANLLMVLILVMGTVSLFTMRIEGFPKIPADTIQIETIYAEMRASQVDEQITQKIEKSLEGIPGIEKIRSVSIDELSTVTVKKTASRKLEDLLDDVRLRVGSISNFPKSAEKPVISKNDFDLPALIVQVHGEVDRHTLQKTAHKVRQQLLAQPEISKLTDWGREIPEISIDVRPELLEKYHLSLQQVMEKIRESSFQAKGGVLKTQGGYISILSDSQAYFYEDFAKIVIVEKTDGTHIFLKDIAVIQDGFVETDSSVRFNGSSAVGMEVLIGRKENLLEISAVVGDLVERLQPTLPEGVHLDVWGDSSHYISERLSLLQSNAIQGLFLVFILLAVFLNIKLAFWVAMGIPVAVLGAISVIALPTMDYSLNDITTFGLIIILGIIVDDAVVVGESIFTERQKNPNVLEATDKGVEKVAVATIFGVLTSVAAFYPLMLLDNALGKVLASFAVVVILALLFSLLESKFILPSHLAHTRLDSGESMHCLSRFWKRVQSFFQKGLERFTQSIYLPILNWCLHQRYAVFVLFVTVAISSLVLMEKGVIRTTFFPDVPGQFITVKLEMDTRTPSRLMMAHSERFEASVAKLNQRYQTELGLAKKPIKQLLVVVFSPQKMELYAELSLEEDRPNLKTLEIMAALKQEVGELEGTNSLVYSGSDDMAGGFSLELVGDDTDTLKAASEELKVYLSQIKGVSSIRDVLVGGKPELSLKLKPEAASLGLTMEAIALQIGFRFNGAEVQRIQRDNQETRIMLRGPKEARNTLADLMNSRIKKEDGHWIPLQSVVTIQARYGERYIERSDRQRVNTVQAHIDKNIVSPSEIAFDLEQNLLPHLKQTYPEVQVLEAGELEEMGKMRTGLLKALVVISLLIYVLLAIPLKSYIQPVVIMTVVPFGFIGAFLGHWIMDLPFSVLSFFGMLALTGIIVNDSLVLMTRFNQIHESKGFERHHLHDTLLETASSRLRAIFLTTVTTVAGLTPLMFETSEQSQYLIPAAVSLAYGELFGTLLTLILVPVSIYIYHDIKYGLLGKSYRKTRPKFMSSHS